MKVKSWLPIFPGFYESIFECDSEDSEIEYYNEQNNTNLNYDDFDWDYNQFYEDSSRAIFDCIKAELIKLFPNLEMKYEELYSPKEYNFHNDSIHVEYNVSEDTMDEIKKYLSKHFDSFSDYITANYKSHDGFIPSYSDDAAVWLYEYMEEEGYLPHCLGAVLEFILLNEGYSIEDLYYDLQDFGVYINYKPAEYEDKENIKTV